MLPWIARPQAVYMSCNIRNGALPLILQRQGAFSSIPLHGGRSYWNLDGVYSVVRGVFAKDLVIQFKVGAKSFVIYAFPVCLSESDAVKCSVQFINVAVKAEFFQIVFD